LGPTKEKNANCGKEGRNKSPGWSSERTTEGQREKKKKIREKRRTFQPGREQGKSSLGRGSLLCSCKGKKEIVPAAGEKKKVFKKRNAPSSNLFRRKKRPLPVCEGGEEGLGDRRPHEKENLPP